MRNLKPFAHHRRTLHNHLRNEKIEVYDDKRGKPRPRVPDTSLFGPPVKQQRQQAVAAVAPEDRKKEHQRQKRLQARAEKTARKTIIKTTTAEPIQPIPALSESLDTVIRNFAKDHPEDVQGKDPRQIAAYMVQCDNLQYGDVMSRWDRLMSVPYSDNWAERENDRQRRREIADEIYTTMELDAYAAGGERGVKIFHDLHGNVEATMAREGFLARRRHEPPQTLPVIDNPADTKTIKTVVRLKLPWRFGNAATAGKRRGQ